MANLRRKAVWGLAVALWLLVPATGAAEHGSGKRDRVVTSASGSGRQRVIIRTKPGAQTSVRHQLEKHGDAVDRVHKLVHAVSARVSPGRLAALAADPDVESISTDAVVSGFASKKRPRGPKRVAAPTVQQLIGLHGWFSGSSITVAVIDSGIAPGPDFDTRIVGFYDFTRRDGGVAVAPYDDYGHGTHVAGLIASNGTSSGGAFSGVAPNAKLLGVKVLNKNGVGRTSDVISALEFVVANKDRFGVDIVNLSLGHPIYESAATDPLVQAVEAAVRAGLVVVVAAGNNGTNPLTGETGYGGVSSPGNAPSAITVGAADTNGTVARADDRVTRYSSRGPSWFDGIAKPDLVAPGHGLISNAAEGSTLTTEYPELLVQNGSSTFLKLNGSSMASGIATGLVAVMLDANASAARARHDVIKGSKEPYVAPPPLRPHAVKAMLQYSATPVRDAAGVHFDLLTQGTGLLNGAGAATLAYFTDTTRPVGSYWAVAAIPPTTTYGGAEEPWSQSLIWGTRLLRGSSLVELHQSAWAENIVWGTGEFNIVWGTVSLDGENIVWGTTLGGDFNVVWGGNVQFGENIVWGTLGGWNENIVWGTGLVGYFNGENIVWGTVAGGFNIVWGTLLDENIVWGTSQKKVTVLGTGGAL